MNPTPIVDGMPPTIADDADVVDETAPVDVEMHQRMDEDEAQASRRSSADCDMAEAMSTDEPPQAPIPTEPLVPPVPVVVPSIFVEQLTAAAAAAYERDQQQMQPTFEQPAEMPQQPLSNNQPAEQLEQLELIRQQAMLAQLPADDEFDVEPPPAEQPTVQQKTPAERDEFGRNRLIELSRQSWGIGQPNYLRGCLWSPDGTCLLTAVNRDGMHVVELPADLYAADRMPPDRPLDLLTSAVHVREMGTVYDYCWYPFMSSSDAASCCWLSTHQHGPIQMWDAFDGRLRCSYRGYDAVDEVEAALSVCFGADGRTVVGGYRKSVKVFRTDVPGRDFVHFPLRTAASCMAVHERNPDELAVGSWSGDVSLHDTRSATLMTAVRRLRRRRAGGVTQLRYSPDGQHLWVGSRKDGVLACWDVRWPDEPVLLCRRTVRTNQRVQLDVSAGGRWLASGDTDGLVRVWDLRPTVRAAEDADVLREYRFALHQDCCNGVALHPSRPVLATCSGQHHFEATAAVLDPGSPLMAPTPPPPTKENSLILWWYGRGDDDE